MFAETNADIQGGTRHGRPLAAVTRYPEAVDRWAIIIGISLYAHKDLNNLQYACRDADELYKLIQTPSGGGFERAHIIKLTDAEATTANVTRALRSFLKKPAREDIVLLYFAAHAAPDPDRPSIVYLLTHDTVPDDIAGTALPMREINLALQENLLAERVVLIADTCHSASVAGGIGRRSGVNDTEVVNHYLRVLSETQDGLAVLTSAEANETSLEDERWGGGHGVFTYYLLEGMRGSADRERNGVVTVGELFEYVRESVQKATDNRQHPSIGPGRFDRTLPMAITAGITAREHYRLGCHLYHQGLKLADRDRFAAASRQFIEARRQARLSRIDFPEAVLELTRSWLARKDDEAAVATLKPPADGADPPSETWLLLGIAYARAKRFDTAVSALERFVELQPDHEYAAWSAEYAAFLRTMVRGERAIGGRYALLIGVDTYTIPGMDLRGPTTDVRLLRELLIRSHGLQPENILILINDNATCAGIHEAFKELRAKVGPNDSVIVYFSGHSQWDEAEQYLIVYDSVRVDGPEVGCRKCQKVVQ